MGQLFTISLFEMKVLLAISTLMVVANAMPTQYVLVPLNQLHYIQPQYHHRVARSAWPQEVGPPGPGAFSIPANIRATEDNLSAGSSPGYANAGPDYVDYGAYTGGYGAFGWYTDHPVLVQHGAAHHR